MIWPLDAIAGMPDLCFLGLYVCVIVLTVAGCRWLLRRRDRTADLAPPLVPSRPDLVEIAYLRGGANEVLRLLLVSLLEKRFLLVEDGNPPSLARASTLPADTSLAESERRLLDGFSSPRTVAEIFQDHAVLSQVEGDCAPRRARLEAEQLITPASETAMAWRIGLLGAVVIVGLVGLRLLATLQAGHQDVPLLVAVSCVALVLLGAGCQPGRLSARGKGYLERLRQAYGQAEHQVSLLMALYGVGILSQTTAYRYAELFPKASGSSEWGVSVQGCGSCGASCGDCGGCGDCGD